MLGSLFSTAEIGTSYTLILKKLKKYPDIKIRVINVYIDGMGFKMDHQRGVKKTLEKGRDDRV